MKFPGFSRVRSERAIGPDEGVEDKETIESYEIVNRQLPSRFLRTIGLRRLKRMKPQGVLADLGCGPGIFTGDVAKAFPGLKVIAFDISAGMLELAGNYLESAKLTDRTSLMLGNLQKLPFGDDSLDVIVSTFSLHHWIDPQGAFGEIHRVLKPQGQFLVFDTRRDAPGIFFLALKFLQKFFLPAQLKEKNEPLSSFMASYTPEEANRLTDGVPFSEVIASSGFFWLYVTGRKL